MLNISVTPIKYSPDTVQEVAVIVRIDKEVIPYTVVQHSMVVLEIVEDTQDGTVVIVWGQRR